MDWSSTPALYTEFTTNFHLHTPRSDPARPKLHLDKTNFEKGKMEDEKLERL
jgi:hypothetical protein